MTRILKHTVGVLLAAVALIAGASPAKAAFIRVGVVSGGSATGSALVSQLNDSSAFNFMATSLNASQADTLAELSNYDVIVLGDSGFADNGYTPAMYAAVRQFMQNGGGVVTTGWYNFATDFINGQAAIDANFITPIADGPYNYDSAPGTVVVNSSHAITQGLTNFSYSGNYIEYATAVDPGAFSLGSLTENASAVTIAYQDLVGRSVYLGGLYLANQTFYNNAGLRSGQEDRLLEQAVAWASSEGVEPTPAPPGAVLFAIGLVGLAGFRRLRRNAEAVAIV